jgi:hypothetical protein
VTLTDPYQMERIQQKFEAPLLKSFVFSIVEIVSFFSRVYFIIGFEDVK